MPEAWVARRVPQSVRPASVCMGVAVNISSIVSRLPVLLVVSLLVLPPVINNHYKSHYQGVALVSAGVVIAVATTTPTTTITTNNTPTPATATTKTTYRVPRLLQLPLPCYNYWSRFRAWSRLRFNAENPRLGL